MRTTLINLLFNTKHKMLKALCNRYVKGRTDPDDIMQSIGLTILNCEDVVLPEPGKEVAWLCQVLVNRAITATRNKNVSKTTSLAGDWDVITEETPESQLLENKDYTLLYQAIKQLPTKQARAISLHYFEELGRNDQTEMHPESFKTNYRLGRLTLTKLLEPYKAQLA